MLKLGINRALWIFGFVQVVTIFGFALLSEIGVNNWVLAAVLFAEYVGVGLGSAALVAFIARSTAREFAATQLALLTAIQCYCRGLLPVPVQGRLSRRLVTHRTSMFVWPLRFPVCCS